MDGLEDQAMNPRSLLLLPSFFFPGYKSSMASASSVTMATNVESQLWFCLGSPLGLFLFSLVSSDLQSSNPLPCVELVGIYDFAQIAVANYSDPV